ncbi:MAG: hypothetical protein QOJ64_1450 [Acidobacteriota bacterium]|jgi:alkylated DNA repair dioxygenase AlkB|nr:hypothetical protein [Acidobacteriota bacterium]
MMQQMAFINGPSDKHENALELPGGLSYREELISPSEEAALVARVRELPFKEFDFHGFKGKRRVVSFGWQYEFSGRGTLRKADDVPEFLLPLRAAAEKFAGMKPKSLQHVLVIEYGPGAGIGWHRDKPVFGEVVGVSLLAQCTLRFRRKRFPTNQVNDYESRHIEARTGSDPVGSTNTNAKWQRVNIVAEPRSAYHLTGPARSEWEHSILRVAELRYAITFRSMREE